MKRLSTLILLTFATLLMLKAQMPQQTGTNNALDYSSLERQLEKSDKDIANAKKAEKSKTWMSRGELMLDIFNVNHQFINMGMSEQTAEILFGKPENENKTQKDGASVDELTYPKVVLTFTNGKLTDWKEVNKIYDNPLPEAEKSFDKAVEVDPEVKDSKDYIADMGKLKDYYTAKAVEEFGNKDYKASLDNFESILNVSKKLSQDPVSDTLIYYNAGLVASMAGLHQESIKYYELARQYNYPKPELYTNLEKQYFEIGDTTNGVKMLDDGFKKFPNSQSIQVELIRYYLQSGKSDEALNYLKMAQQGDPNNVSFIFAEGTIYDKMGQTDKAEAAYKKCIAMDPNYFNAYYNLGVLYYNKASNMYDAANSIQDNQQYEKAKKAADEELAKAIPEMEKAHELHPKDTDTLQTLKTIFYRLQMKDKLQEVTDKLDSLTGASE